MQGAGQASTRAHAPLRSCQARVTRAGYKYARACSRAHTRAPVRRLANVDRVGAARDPIDHVQVPGGAQHTQREWAPGRTCTPCLCHTQPCAALQRCTSAHVHPPIKGHDHRVLLGALRQARDEHGRVDPAGAWQGRHGRCVPPGQGPLVCQAARVRGAWGWWGMAAARACNGSVHAVYCTARLCTTGGQCTHGTCAHACTHALPARALRHTAACTAVRTCTRTRACLRPSPAVRAEREVPHVQARDA